MEIRDGDGDNDGDDGDGDGDGGGEGEGDGEIEMEMETVMEMIEMETGRWRHGDGRRRWGAWRRLSRSLLEWKRWKRDEVTNEGQGEVRTVLPPLLLRPAFCIGRETGWGADGRSTVRGEGQCSLGRWGWQGLVRFWNKWKMAQGSRCRTVSRFQVGRGSSAIITVTVTFLGGNWGVRMGWGDEGLKQEERCETAHRRELTGNVGLLGGQGAHLRDSGQGRLSGSHTEGRRLG